MSLDVGVVKICYLDRPEGVAYRFAWHLAINCDDADWTVSSDGHTVVEYDYDHMLSVADEYAATESLSSEDRARLNGWVKSLPWEDYTVMLHLAA